MSSNGPSPPFDARLELEKLAEQVEWITTFEGLRPLFYRMSEIAKQFPADAEVQGLAGKIKRRIAERGKLLRHSAEASPPVESFPTPAGPLSDEPDADDGLHTTQQVAVAGPPPDESPPAAPRRRSPLAGIAVAMAVCAGLIAALWFFFGRGTSALTIAIEFQSSPPGAGLRVDGALRGTTNATLDLAPGAHKIEAVLQGYEPAVSTVTIGEDLPRTVNLTLIPRSQTLRIFADFREGEVHLDGELEGRLEEGQLVLAKVPPGEHAVEIISGHIRAAFAVEISPGAKPRLVSPIEASNVLAVLINSAGTQASAYSSAAMVLQLDGQVIGIAGPDGIVLPEVRPGDHEIILGEGAGARSLVAEFGVSPALTVFLKLDINAGTLVVVTAEDEVRVLLDGKEQRRLTSNGQLRIPRLGVREDRVSVHTEGSKQPAEQTVQVRKGSETRVAFDLEPLSQLASLIIAGALPGAEVSLDGSAIGIVHADGGFSSKTVAPGRRVIELRKQRYKPVQLVREFTAGESVEIGKADLTMELALGAVRLSVSPASATTTYRQIDQEKGQPVPGNGFALPAGSYVVSVAADGYLSKEMKVEVMAGATHDIELHLAEISKPEPLVLGMGSWQNPQAWVSQGSWQVVEGDGGFVPFGLSPVHGKLSFMVRVLGGKRIRWAFQYIDSENYLLFELDRKRFYRKQVTNGKTQELLKSGLPLKDPQFFTLSIEVAPGLIAHRLMVDGKWVVIDTWEDSSIDFTQGSFGIITREKRQYGLSNFSYTPNN